MLPESITSLKREMDSGEKQLKNECISCYCSIYGFTVGIVKLSLLFSALDIMCTHILNVLQSKHMRRGASSYIHSSL